MGSSLMYCNALASSQMSPPLSLRYAEPSRPCSYRMWCSSGVELHNSKASGWDGLLVGSPDCAISTRGGLLQVMACGHAALRALVSKVHKPAMLKPSMHEPVMR